MMLVFVGVVVVVSYDMHKLNDEETTSQSLALDRFGGGATGCSWKKKEGRPQKVENSTTTPYIRYCNAA